MTAASTSPMGLTLSIHPVHRGFGWVAFEGPFSPYDWGLVFAQRDKNEKCLKRVDHLFDRLVPHTIVLEDFERGASSKISRITHLCRAIVSMAISRGVEVAIYARGEVQACFATVGARSRHEIAEAIVRNIEALGHKLPPKRKPWQSEDRRMALFAAAALVLTHYQLGSSRLFDNFGFRT